MPKLEFGLFLEFTTSDDERLDKQVDRYLPIIGLAESLGFRSVWVGESYPPARGAIQHISSPFLVLSHLAHQTSMTLGTAVSLAPVWDPLRLAYDTSVLDQLCGGRLILGVGLGNPGIWKRFGVDRDSVGQRTDETLLALRALWAGEDGYEGDLVKVIGGIAPRPLQPGGPPILIGGKIPRSARRAATLGDGFVGGTHFTWDQLRTLIGLYHEALESAGKEVEDSTVSANRIVVLADDPDEAWRDAAPYLAKLFRVYAKIGLVENADALFGAEGGVLEVLKEIVQDICLIGSPETVATTLADYAAAGVTQLQLRPAPALMPTRLVERTVRLAGEKLVPAFDRVGRIPPGSGPP